MSERERERFKKRRTIKNINNTIRVWKVDYGMVNWENFVKQFFIEFSGANL